MPGPLRPANLPSIRTGSLSHSFTTFMPLSSITATMKAMKAMITSSATLMQFPEIYSKCVTNNYS